MAYRRRYGGYRRRRRAYHSRASGWAGMARTALKTARFVASLVNAEEKYNDVHTQFYFGQDYCQELTSIPQGTDADERNGNSIRAKSLWVRVNTKADMTYFNNIGTYPSARLIIFIDTNQDGSAPVPSDVLETVSVVSPLNTDNVGRFTILKDIFYPLTLGQSTKSFEIYLPLNHHVRYSGPGATAPELRDGNMYLIWISDLPPSGGGPITAAGETDVMSRFRFLDN